MVALFKSQFSKSSADGCARKAVSHQTHKTYLVFVIFWSKMTKLFGVLLFFFHELSTNKTKKQNRTDVPEKEFSKSLHVLGGRFYTGTFVAPAQGTTKTCSSRDDMWRERDNIVISRVHTMTQVVL